MKKKSRTELFLEKYKEASLLRPETLHLAGMNISVNDNGLCQIVFGMGNSVVIESSDAIILRDWLSDNFDA